MNRPELPSCDDRLIWDVWMSSYHFPALAAADELGLFALLYAQPATADEIARALSLSPRASEALLGVLTSLGFLVQRAGRFHLADVSRNFLLPSSPTYWGGALRFFRDIPVTHVSVLQSIREDTPEPREGGDHELQPELARAFTQAMHALSFPAAMGAALHGDFAGVHRLLDVAGGSGSLCIALALRHPSLHCTVLDLPAVCPTTQQYLAEYGLQDRVETIGLDMFQDAWPAGYDATFFGNIFHDLQRADCLRLARKSFEVLPPGGRIYVHEILLNDTCDGPLTATGFSMAMLSFTDGKQLSGAEIEGILREAGFGEIQVTPTVGYYALIRGSKPGGVGEPV